MWVAIAIGFALIRDTIRELRLGWTVVLRTIAENTSLLNAQGIPIIIATIVIEGWCADSLLNEGIRTPR